MLFAGRAGFGQISEEEQTQIDSLTVIVNNSESNDTSASMAYVELSNLLYGSNSDTVIPLCLKAVEITQENLSRSFSSSDEDIVHKASLQAILADAYNNIGFVHHASGDTEKGLEYLLKSLEMHEEIAKSPDPKSEESGKNGVAVASNNISVIYRQIGDIERALIHLDRSISMRIAIGDKKGEAYSLNNMAVIYKLQGDLEQALGYYLQSLELLKEYGSQKTVARSMNNVGQIYEEMGELERALSYYQESMEKKVATGDEGGISNSLNNIAGIYTKQGHFKNALEYHLRSLAIREKTDDSRGIAESLNHISVIYLEQENLYDAKKNAQKSLKLAQELGYPDDIKGPANTLTIIHKKNGDFKEALEMYELQIKMRDSINNEETQKATIRQQTKYEFEKAQLVKEQKEKELARIQDEATSRRDNLQYSVILISLLVIGILLAVIGRFSIPTHVAEGLIFFSFLILFEFLLVLADPYIENWSGGAPGIKLLFNAGIAALIFPAHAFFEAKLKGRLVRK